MLLIDSTCIMKFTPNGSSCKFNSQYSTYLVRVITGFRVSYSCQPEIPKVLIYIRLINGNDDDDDDD